MKVTLEQTQKLLISGKDHRFDSLALSMLVTNLRNFHSRSPSEFTLENCTDMINSFFDKFKLNKKMNGDFEIIASL